jgi:hypothetical protein
MSRISLVASGSVTVLVRHGIASRRYEQVSESRSIGPTDGDVPYSALPGKAVEVYKSWTPSLDCKLG